MTEELAEKIKKLSLPLLMAQEIELVELILRREGQRRILRFLVDKPGGITLDECARLNQEIGQLLDRENIIQESYVLEVSSPGLDRPLKTTRDLKRCLGKLVKIVLHRPINKQNVYKGILDEADDDYVTIHTEEGERVQIGRNDIARTNLEVDFS